MQQTFQQEAEKYTKSNRGRRVWQRFVRVMAGFVVFCTTYALILPAITLEENTFCGLEEHKHTEGCYIQPTRPTELVCTPDQIEVHVHTDACLDASGNTVCGQADYIAHTHDAGCYDMAGSLVCTFAEAAQHAHADSCYAPVVIPADSHTHTDACYNKVKGDLTCGSAEQEAHTHSDTCYAAEATQICGRNETQGHAHGDGCYTTENALTCGTAEDETHTHGDGCYTAQQNLTCGQTEQEAHTHSDGCYEKAITCGLIQMEAHTHTDICYAWTQENICGLEETPIPEPELICTTPVSQKHVHGDGCFVTAEELPLTCGLEETPATEAAEATDPTVAAETAETAEPHTHTFLCYGEWELICPTEEHTHSLACFSDPEADVESEADWKRTLPEELTGVYVNDLLAVAGSQLGYTESEKNYIVLEEDGETKQGYTRYGAWYGDPYGEWDDMYASFCLYYAGANELEALEDFPLESDTAEWVEKLKKAEIYLSAADGTPEPGDLAFFDNDGDTAPDHVAIVTEIFNENGTTKLRVYEGDVENQVQKNKYALADSAILGYGLLPEVPDYDPETGEPPMNVYTYSDGTLYVEVKLPFDSGVPEDAVLKVSPIVSEDEEYEGYVLRAEEAVAGTMESILLYDISFYDAEGNYIPVGNTAEVSLRFTESPVDADADVVVLHYTEENTAPVVIEDVTIAEETVAAAATFSLRSRVVETTQTVVAFETNGFSVFAVVGIETAAQYVTPILDQAAIPDGLDGKVLIISTTDVYDGAHQALTAENVVISENHDGGYKDDNRLKAAAVTNDGTNVTATANYNVLWKFTAVEGKPGVYTIESVANPGMYLTINANRNVLTSAAAAPQEITVTVNEAGNVQLQSADLALSYDTDAVDQGADDPDIPNFRTWGAGYVANFVTLSEYTDDSLNEPVTIVSPVTGMAGKAYIIAGVDNNDGDIPAILTSDAVAGEGIWDQELWKPGLVGAQYGTECTVSDDYGDGEVATVTVGGDTTTAVWLFEAASDDKYYIKSLKTNTYLNIAPNNLSLGNPQAIEVVEDNGDYYLRVPADNGGFTYVNLCGNTSASDFTGYTVAGGGLGDNGNHLALIEVNSVRTDLAGKQFVISAVNIIGEDNNTLRALTSTKNDTNTELLGKNVFANYNAAGDTVTSISADSGDDIIWEFEAVDAAAGQYRVRSVATGEYLQINDNSLTTVQDANAANTTITVEQVAEPGVDDNITVTDGVVCLFANEQRVNLNGNGPASDFSNWYGGTGDPGNHLILTEYKPLNYDAVTNLDEEQLYIVSTAAIPQVITPTVNNNQLQGMQVDNVSETGSLFYDIEDQGNNITEAHLWTFHAVDGKPGVYTIQSSMGQYLNISNGGSNLGEPQEITVFATTVGGKQEILLHVEIDGVSYYLNRFGGGNNTGYGGWTGVDGGSQFVLCKEVTTKVNFDITLTYNESLGDSWLYRPRFAEDDDSWVKSEEITEGGHLPVSGELGAEPADIANQGKSGVQHFVNYHTNNLVTEDSAFRQAHSYFWYEIDSADDIDYDAIRQAVYDPEHFTDESPYWGKEFELTHWEIVGPDGGRIMDGAEPAKFAPGTEYSLNAAGQIVIKDVNEKEYLIDDGSTFEAKYQIFSDVMTFYVNHTATVLDTTGDIEARNVDDFTLGLALSHIYYPLEAAGDEENKNEVAIHGDITELFRGTYGANVDPGVGHIVLDGYILRENDEDNDGDRNVITWDDKLSNVFVASGKGMGAAALEEHVMEYIRTVSDVDISLLAFDASGNTVVATLNNDTIDSASFYVRWYVVKEHADAWHIDGVMVGKTEPLTVTKTFHGLPAEQVDTLMDGFVDETNQDADHEDNVDKFNIGVSVLDLKIRAGNYFTMYPSNGTYAAEAGMYSFDSDEVTDFKSEETYSWTMHPIVNLRYQLEEENYQVEGYDSIQTVTITDKDGTITQYSTSTPGLPGEGEQADPFIVTGGDTTSVEYHNYYTLNDTGMFAIRKVDSIHGMPLEGAEFILGNNAGGYYQLNDGEAPKVVTDTASATRVTTDASGIALFYNLPEGDYWVIEDKAPTGFMASGQTWHITVGENGVVVYKYTENDVEKQQTLYDGTAIPVLKDYLEITNAPEAETMKVVKIFEGISAQQVASLANHEDDADDYKIEIKDSDGNVRKTLKLTAHEGTTPSVSNGGLTYTWIFSMDDGGDFTVTESNYEITNMVTTITEWGESDENYTTKVTSPPDVGYNTASFTATFTEDQIDGFTIKNSYSDNFKIKILKVDSVEKKPLAGAQFEIYGPLAIAPAGAKSMQVGDRVLYCLGTVTTDDNGEVEFSGNAGHPLELGYRYALVEIKAPDGYNLLRDPIDLGTVPPSVTQDEELDGGMMVQPAGYSFANGVCSITVENQPAYELPMTGAAGTYQYTIGGLLVMMAAAILLYNHTKRGKEEHASS